MTDTEKLVLVVGAGASLELGLPTGDSLRETISDLVNIRFAGGRFSGGDQDVWQAMKLLATETGVDSATMQRAAWRIRDAMPQATSIDNFINLANDKNVELVGKLAIVKSILAAEASSKLRIDMDRTKLNFSDLAKTTWLVPFFQLLVDGCRLEDLEARFNQVSIICFNYDRCIEHYLVHALQPVFGIDETRAAKLLENLEIYHPYGSAGGLPWQSAVVKVSFGEEVTSHTLVTLAGQIKTFTEGTDPGASEIIAIRRALTHARKVLFIGFGYHKQNLDLLCGTDLQSAAANVWGTAFKMSKANVAYVRQVLTERMHLSRDFVDIQDTLEARTIFHEYSMPLVLEGPRQHWPGAIRRADDRSVAPASPRSLILGAEATTPNLIVVGAQAGSPSTKEHL